MRKSVVIFFLATTVFMVACGVQRKTAKTADSALTPAERGYTGGRESTYYYTEGVKLANIYGARDSAIWYFQRALELDPAHAPSYYSMAHSYALKDPVKALELSNAANRLDRANALYRSQLAGLMILNGDYDSARDTYRELIQIAPRDPENYRMLAALYEAGDQPLSALAVLDSAELKFGKVEHLAYLKRELLLKMRLFDRVIDETNELIEEYPYNADNYLALSEAYLARGDDSLAYQNISKALELDPEGVGAQISLTEYYKFTGDNANFFLAAKKIFLSDEMDFQTKAMFFKDITKDVSTYAANYFQISELAAALAGKYPTNYDAMEMYAQNLFAGGNTEAGINVYKDYLSDTTSILAPYMVIIDGETYLERSDSIKRYTALALERFPDNTDLLVRTAMGHSYAKNYPEAIKTYRKALDVAATDSLRSEILGYIGDTYHETGRMKDCYKYYDRALELNPRNALVLNNYAYFLSEDGRQYEKALAMAEKVMKLKPDDASYVDTYAWVLHKLGRNEEAKKAMVLAISLAKEGNKEHFLHYGDILYELGDFFMAKYYWQKALEAGYDEAKITERTKKLDGR